jgi:alpha 1,2-mannosyltransferase
LQVHFLCDIDYDIFRFMRDNNMKYGFNMNILDDARSFPSLYSTTRRFIATHPHLTHPEADLRWLLDPHNNNGYNNCQFFSNFEIGSLNFWRSPQAETFFNYLDKAGGFYYERFGDAPVHTLSVAMFVPRSEVWFFRDIGYQHDINHQCPAGLERKCACEPTRLDENFYKLIRVLGCGWVASGWTRSRDGVWKVRKHLVGTGMVDISSIDARSSA